MTPNERLIHRARGLPKVRVQNGLMRSGDREIALSMMYMEDSDRAYFFSFLPAAKAKRIREELSLQQRLKITYDQYKKAITALTENLGNDRGGDSIKSYIRPAR
jgi:hypothetical protein